MAAARSSLARLSRRGYVSSAAARGGVLDIPHVVRPAVAGTPPLRPAAVGNLESLHWLSTAGKEPTGKAEGVMRMWVERCRNRVNNLDVYDRAKLSYAYAVVVLGGSTLYMMKG
ncbi:unnamed protein product [Urochloa humidicola]